MNKLNVNPTIQEFTKSLEKLLEFEKESQKAYSHQHQAMVDIQHEIELSVGYEDSLKLSVFDDLKSAAQERRLHKDSILLIDLLRKTVRQGAELEDIVRVLQTSEEWSRDYSPRVVKTLKFSSPEALKESRINLDKRQDED